MNYMPELNAFAERMRRNPLSNNAQLLWYKLMDTANRLHWPETFQLDNARIMQMMNVGSRHTAAAARQELVDDGLLEFIAGAKGKPSVYKMLSVAALEGPPSSRRKRARRPPTRSSGMSRTTSRPTSAIPRPWDKSSSRSRSRSGKSSSRGSSRTRTTSAKCSTVYESRKGTRMAAGL